jgi:competence protein ComEC
MLSRLTAPAITWFAALALGIAAARGDSSPTLALGLIAAGIALGVDRRAGALVAFFGLGSLIGVPDAQIPSGVSTSSVSSGSIGTARLVVESAWTVEPEFDRARAAARIITWRSGAGRAGATAALVTTTPVLLDLPADSPRPPRGSIVRVRGEVRTSRHFFNRVPSSMGRLALVVKSERWLAIERRPAWNDRWADAARRWIDRALPPVEEQVSPGRALARALVLGDTAGFSTATWRALRQTGLAHLAAVSGFNVAVLLGLLWFVARCLGLRGSALQVVAGTGAAAYLWVLGNQASAARATLMAALVAAALLARRLPWSLQMVGLAGSLLLLFEPRWLTTLSFQLTFAATLGLLLGAPGLARQLKGLGLPSWLADGLAVGASAQIATAPWTLTQFHSLVGLGLLWNLLAAPWAAICFLAAVACLPLLSVSGEAGILATALLDGLAKPLEWLARATPIPGTWSWAGETWVAILGATGFAVALWLPRRWPWRVLGALIGLVSWGWPLRDRTPVEVRLVAFDVGHGDALLLEGGGARVLVDGGGRGPADFGGRVLAPALARRGAFQLDAMLLSHFDADHCQGLLDLTHVLPVLDVWTGPGWERSPCAVQLRARAKRRSGVVARGERLEYGAWTLRILSPPRDDPSGLAAGKTAGRGDAGDNDASVVADARAQEARVLLLGDLGGEGERWLAFREGGRLRADVLKVAHHGSAESTTARLLDEVRPELALISAARADPFGHPAGSTLARLSRAGVHVLRTDLDGEIDLEWSAGRRRLSRPAPILVPGREVDTD